MNDPQKAIARACLEGAENNTMNFSEIVGTLIEAGFEGLRNRLPAGDRDLLSD